MGDAKAIEAILELPGNVLDWIVALLARVGIDLTPLILQVFLLLLIIALLVPACRTFKARKKVERTPLISVAALGLVALGVLAGLVDNATMPERVGGTLQSATLTTVRLALLDFRDHEISLDSGRPDTTSGRFAMHYNPLTDGRARKLRVTAPNCKPQEFVLSRAQLRSGAELAWTYQCVAD